MVSSSGMGGPTDTSVVERFRRLLDTVEDFYTTGQRRPARPVRPAPIAMPAVPTATSGQANPRQLLDEVASEVATCRRCGLCQTRTNTVPGEGPTRPVVLVIGLFVLTAIVAVGRGFLAG